MVFFVQTTLASSCKNLTATLFFEKNAKFFAENRRKSPKIAENRDDNIDPTNHQ
jgi:hypothetical protein